MTAPVSLPFVFPSGAGLVRPWRREDRASLLRHADNPNVARYLSLRFPNPYTSADADAWFAFLDSQEDPEGWAIEVQGEAVGGIGVRRGAAEFAHSAELGYWLGEAYWRRGIVTAAVREVVPFVTERWGLARLTAYASARNVGSIHVLEGAGFVREGLVRARAFRDGHAYDHVMFGRVDPQRLREWMARYRR
ncbi:GNAT family N-acetyltransferase [Arenimonas terrae]|uniref:N-acetyltransferase n=1 Tax=Arenimonas terrae TaxID=2546226 RepID=A0A5C4RVS1_9GAMM|nr:GNAT family protein [Arenimonas terrae]TNJ35124.1 N-acetyltransferase [Arenimonas terrae]